MIILANRLVTLDKVKLRPNCCFHASFIHTLEVSAYQYGVSIDVRATYGRQQTQHGPANAGKPEPALSELAALCDCLFPAWIHSLQRQGMAAFAL